MHLVTVSPGDMPAAENIATPESFPVRTTVPVWTEVVAVVVAVNCAKTPLGNQSAAATGARTNRVRAQRPPLDCVRVRKEGIEYPPFAPRRRHQGCPPASPLLERI